jgi:hypothetical protein
MRSLHSARPLLRQSLSFEPRAGHVSVFICYVRHEPAALCFSLFEVSFRGEKNARYGTDLNARWKFWCPASGVKSAGLRTSRDGTPWESFLGLEAARVFELQTLLSRLTALELRDTSPALLPLAIAEYFSVEELLGDHHSPPVR